MKDLYTEPIEEAVTVPYLRYAIDWEAEGEPLKAPRRSLVSIISDHIFIPGDDRTPNISTLPEDRDQFPIPPPKYS